MALIANPDIDVVDRGDRRSRRRHRPLQGGDRGTASTSSWSTSRPTRWPGRCWRARREEAGVVYSLAWGDQPALICEHVDWARTCGFKVVAAGKGTRYHPTYHRSTPDTVWEILDQYLKIKDRSHINPKMFNSFIDGTKSGIEMTAVCNATGLVPQSDGLGFPPASRFELADVCKPKSEGGTLEKKGVTEVVSSLTRDGKDVPHHLAMGTYVVVESDSPYAGQCFVEYNCLPDKSGKYAALYRPTHMIGLELGISVASAALRKEPTGAPDLLQLRRGRHRQAPAEEGRGARRRRRLLRLGQADAGRCVAAGGLSAARPRPRHPPHPRHRRRPAAAVVRRRLRRRRRRRQSPPRDGGDVRQAEPLSDNVVLNFRHPSPPHRGEDVSAP